MARPKASTPKYRFHVSGQAVVSFCGKNFYLGEHDSPESWAKYHSLVAEYIRNGRAFAPQADVRQADVPITVECVTAEFRQHANIRYANNPRELNRFDNICKVLESEFGDSTAIEFGPRKLSKLRDLFVANGNTRTYANRLTRHVVAVFNYAVSRELIGPERIIALKSLEPLKYGQTTAPEPIPVEAVDLDAVRSTAKFLSPTLKAMVHIQATTGMRSGEIVIIRPADIDQSNSDGGMWIYTPRKHKTTHRGKTKSVPLNDDAQSALGPFLDRDPDMFCFSAKESAQWYREQRTANRKTKDGPGRNKPGTNRKANPQKQPRDFFDTGSYCKALQNAQKKANVERWSPHQMRHAAASAIRDALDIESAQALLGHSDKQITMHYAKRSMKLAIEAARAAPKL